MIALPSHSTTGDDVQLGQLGECVVSLESSIPSFRTELAYGGAGSRCIPQVSHLVGDAITAFGVALQWIFAPIRSQDRTWLKHEDAPVGEGAERPGEALGTLGGGPPSLLDP